VFHDISLATGLFLLTASFFAGFVDSIAGGGGLIQLPALLIGLPKSETAEVLGTNKLSAVFGTTTAAALYRKQIKPDPKILIAMGAPAFLGSAGGAVLASKIPTSSMRPMVLVLLIVVAIYTWFKPDLGKFENLKFQSGRRVQIAALAGAVIGFYDGIFGPGTGSFLMLILVASLGYAFITASAIAKVVNVATKCWCDSCIWISRGGDLADRNHHGNCQYIGGNYRVAVGDKRWLNFGAESLLTSHAGINC
jgi:uncharacterized membrane protein YfcA